MAGNRPKKPAAWMALALLGLVEAALVALSLLALPQASTAQVLDERFPFLEDRARRYRQQRMDQLQQWNQQQWSGPQDQPRAQTESARAPAPRRVDVAPTVNIVVFGDSLADWLGYGLEEAFAETPEIGILRKPRANTGLIRVEQRGESYDWPQSAREMLAAEKPDFVVMMLGVADRRGIREAIRQAARPPAGQKQTGDQAKQAQPGQAKQAAPAQPAQPGQQVAATAAEQSSAKPADAEAPQETQDQPATATESPIAGTVVHEFRSEQWGELYGKRIDEMIGVLKSKNVPVFWVGLPSVRGARATSDMVYLNDLYRGRAEKAGVTYIDVWDGFVDEAGNYNNYGPDFEGQTRRLRAGDGLHFTRAGARKLAHYVEREIRRVMLARATPLATPGPQEPEPDAKEPPAAAAPGLPPRPAASPVMSLTAPRGTGDTLLGATPVRNTADSVATRVLVKGEPIEAPAGRADDFVWPRRDVVTATGVLPPDPVEPPPRAEPAVAATPGTGAAPAKQATAPRPPRERRTETGGWQPWGRPRYEERPRWSPPSFFGWFGR
jgi:uncharacterized protein